MSLNAKKQKQSFLNYLTENKGVFAKGICFKKLLFIFVIGCILGTYYEQILNLVTYYFKDGTIFWETRRGLIYGPLNPLYGGAFAIIVLIFGRQNMPWYKIVIYGTFVGGGIEYLVSFLQETFTGMVSWDYSEHFLNINGRTTIPFAIFWGFLILFMIKVAYPFFSALIESIPINLGNLLTMFLIGFLSVDMFLSFGALFRQNLRREKIPPYTPVGEFFDKHYTDDYLEQFYTNMKESDE